MGGERKQVHTQLFYVNRDCSYSLHSVCMKDYSPLMHNIADLRNWLDGSHFIVGMHQTDQDSLISNSLPHCLRGNHSILVYWEIGYRKTMFFHISTGIQDGMMLSSGRDDMLAFLLVGPGHSGNCQIIPFRTAPGKNYQIGRASCRERV